VESDDLTSSREMLESDWKQDLPNIVLLLVLYTLQGIPMGLSGSIPFLLLDKVSYSEQAIFSLVSIPFSMKLLWAPLVREIGIYAAAPLAWMRAELSRIYHDESVLYRA